MGRRYSYKFDPHTRWDGMIVLFVGPDSLSCGLVESYLISRFFWAIWLQKRSTWRRISKAWSRTFFHLLRLAISSSTLTVRKNRPLFSQHVQGQNPRGRSVASSNLRNFVLLSGGLAETRTRMHWVSMQGACMAKKMVAGLSRVSWHCCLNVAVR